ncbi:MAG: TonB-dependent receptor [Bacteroidia bacterium]|nr:TonB-dependent receptor [Bacteroidia bacterium]
MKQIRTILFILLLFPLGMMAQTGSIKGTVKSKNGSESLVGATVSLKGSTKGANTNEKGAFEIKDLKAGSYTLLVSFIGFSDESREVEVEAGKTASVSISMTEADVFGQEVVISASKRPEKITQAPASVNIIRSQSFEELPSFNVGELAGRTKGVDYVRSGVLGTGLNIRGFNSAFNPKNLQVNDGRFSTLIATGLPLGSLGTVVKEDIERVEIILGPAAALYGPNAHNGLVNTITKDPRDYQGTTLALGAGNQNVLTGRFRHAQVLIKDKLAFKVTGEYTQGTEFDYVDSVYIGGTPFEELELNRDFDVLRGEAQVIYTPKENHDLIFMTGHSNSNNLAQTNAGRNQIKDWRIHYYQFKYQSPRIFAQAYYTQSRTDSTYAINQRTQNYWSYRASGFSDEEAREASYNTAWFPLNADTPSIGIPLNRGAIFKDQSSRLNAEVQANQTWGGLTLIGGAQYQRDMANSLGTYLLDQNGVININQIGVYAQGEYKIGTKAKLMAALRADNHDLYGFNLIPKAAFLYFVPNGAVRLTYSQGIAAPTILNLEATIFGGLLLGNGAGFTLSDGSTIDPLQVEKIQTFEVGYKGTIAERLFVDVNGYFNASRNFLSPAINIARPTDGVLVTSRGDQAIQDVIPGTPEAGAGLVLTYVNFGRVNTYGIDAGLRYMFSKNLDAVLNYSFFGFNLDEDDPENDGNGDGTVGPADLPINTPANKLSAGLNYRNDMFFANVFVRWVQAYDFFSGINVAAATDEELIYNGAPVVENARVGRTWNYGPLGGFVNVDLAAGVKLADNRYVISGQVSNLFNSEVREFVASPAIGRLFAVELKVNLGPIKPIK